MSIFPLLVAFQVKHVLGDYILQTAYMQGKAQKTGWFMPLFIHVLIHSLLTLTIILMSNHPKLAYLALIDLVIHFCVDRFKGVFSRNLIPWNLPFRTAFGSDQMAHHLTHYFIIYLLVGASL